MISIQRAEFVRNNQFVEAERISPQANINNEIYQNLEVINRNNNSTNETVQVKANQLEERVNDLEKNGLPNAEKKIDGHNERLNDLDNKIKNFNVESLKGLSKHFQDNEDEMKNHADKWLDKFTGRRFGGAMGIGLVIQMIFIVYFIASQKLSYLYLLIPYNAIYISLLYFIATQYSHYKRLTLDANNRKIVAQSYLAILNNSTGVEERNTITRIVADTLFSRNVLDSGAELPIKEIVRIGEKILEKK